MPSFPRRVTTRWAGFSVVALQSACETVGLPPERLLAVRGVEQLTRTRAGREEQAVRIPTEILDAAAQNQKRVADVLLSNGTGPSDADLRARIREIIDEGTPRRIERS